jgi:hypothetical protein
MPVRLRGGAGRLAAARGAAGRPGAAAALHRRRAGAWWPQGAAAITTSCGFLVQWQAELQAALPVPVWTSALLALPVLRAPASSRSMPTSLGAAHLLAAGADPARRSKGLAPGCSLQRTLLQDLPTLDTAAAEADRGRRTAPGATPTLANLVLECTNLPPYAAAVQRATGRPVHHLMSLVHERWKSL